MSTSIEKTIQRIKRFSLTCTLNDNGHLRYFHNGHEFVEIGGMKWATCNVGATKPTDNGLYFAWGETRGFTAEQVRNGERRFVWDDYKYENYDSLTKYNDTDKKTVLESIDDAATFNMGIGWRTPTKHEFQSLLYSTTSKWVTNYKGSGVNGRLFIDKNDKSKQLFFPPAGFCYNGSVFGVGDEGRYWWSSLLTRSLKCAFYLYFYSGDTYWADYHYRYYGSAIRGVVAE